MKGVNDMTMYIIDVGEQRCGLSENGQLIADSIMLNRDLIRGFTLNRIIMIRYYEYMTNLIGKYVSLEAMTCEVPENLKNEEYAKLALTYHNDLFDNYGATCPEIMTMRLENGGDVIFTDSMVEQSTSVWEYEEILVIFMFLFDEVIRYIPELVDNDRFTEFRQFILDGLMPRLEDFYCQDNGNYHFDIYAILKMYMDKKIFLGMREEE